MRGRQLFFALLIMSLGVACAGEAEESPAEISDAVADCPRAARPPDLPEVPPLDEGPTVLRPAVLGHGMIWLDRNVLETQGEPDAAAATLNGIIRSRGRSIGLDLVDWRTKDAADLLALHRDLAGAIHLTPKQVCNKRVRAGILAGSRAALALTFTETRRGLKKLPGCLADFDSVALHLVVPDADDELVAGLAALPSLETLILQTSELSDEGIAALGRATGLRTLDLGGAGSAQALASLEPLTSLESLGLFGAALTDEALEHLPNPGGLRRMDLGFTGIGDRGLEHLGRCVELRSLGLWHTGVTDAGLVALARLKRLVALDLAGTEVGDAGVRSLRGHTSLRRLDLTKTRVTDSSLAVLAALPALERLDLGGTAVTDRGLLYLAAFPRLRRVDLWGTEVSEDAVNALRSCRPKMDIRVQCAQDSSCGFDGF